MCKTLCVTHFIWCYLCEIFMDHIWGYHSWTSSFCFCDYIYSHPVYWFSGFIFSTLLYEFILLLLHPLYSALGVSWTMKTVYQFMGASSFYLCLAFLNAFCHPNMCIILRIFYIIPLMDMLFYFIYNFICGGQPCLSFCNCLLCDCVHLAIEGTLWPFFRLE